MEARSGSCKPGTFTSGQVGRTPGSVSGCAVYCAHPAPPVPCLPGFSPGAPDHLTTQQVEGGGTGVWGVRAGPGISLTLPCFSPSRCWRVPKGTSMAISVPGQADPQGWTVWPAGGPQKMAVWCTGSPGGWREGASDTLTCRCQVGGGGGPVVVGCPVTGSHHAGHLGAGLSAQRERDSGPLVPLGWTGGGDAPFGCRARGGGGLAGLLQVSVSPGAGGEAPGPPAASPSPRDPTAPSGWAGLTFPSSAHLCPALAFTYWGRALNVCETVLGTRDQAVARDDDRVAKLDREMAEETACGKDRGRGRACSGAQLRRSGARAAAVQTGEAADIGGPGRLTGRRGRWENLVAAAAAVAVAAGWVRSPGPQARAGRGWFLGLPEALEAEQEPGMPPCAAGLS